MKITLLQNDIVAADPEANRRSFEQMVDSAPQSNLYVLPEMWSTGFMPDPAGVAEADGASLAWMRDLARKRDAAIAGSIAVADAGRYYNRLYFVTPDDVVYYDKHHLFAYSGENLHYTPGRDRVIAVWRGVRFLLQVCYDLRFPVYARNSADESEQYDVALYVASWPESRRRVWDILLQARAIENQCYVCGVNRVGDDAACHYNGGTAAIDPYGRVTARCDDDRAGCVTIEINIDKLQAFRRKFPVLDDAD